VTASVPGQSALTASIPVSVTSAMVAGGGGGVGGGAIALLIGAGAAAAAGVAFALNRESAPRTAAPSAPVTPPGVRITGGAPVFGPPR
jgi:hypothetical protein